MAEKVPNIAPLNYQYTLIERANIPMPYNLYRIDYKKDEISQFEVLFFHRLMRKNFGDPSEIEYDRTKLDLILPQACQYSLDIIYNKLTFHCNTQINVDKSEMESTLIGTELREWKYYFRTTHNDIILMQSERHHSEVSIYHVLPPHAKEPTQKSKAEGEAFIEALLREATRQLRGGQLFNLRAEFESGEHIRHYLLHNVFIENYSTALFLLQASVEGEQELREGELEFDAADPAVRASHEKMEQIKKYQSIRGVYYSSAILHFFMAFEAFVNLIYHAFLKDEFRVEEASIDRRLDLEQKLLFMPALCNGFKDELINNDDFLQIFKQLKNFRNALIHGKISDALFSVSFIEQGFFYSRPIAKQREDAFPPHKVYLDIESVINFAKKVASLLEDIKNRLDDEHRLLVETFFMKEQFISFFKEKDKLRLSRK
jgi:hypothetical protein